MEKSIKWEVKGAGKIRKAKLGKREYSVEVRPGAGFTYFLLTGARGATYRVLPTYTKGIYQVLSTRGANFMGYAKVENGVLVDAPEHR